MKKSLASFTFIQPTLFLCVEKSFQIYQWEKDFLYAYKLTLLTHSTSQKEDNQRNQRSPLAPRQL